MLADPLANKLSDKDAERSQNSIKISWKLVSRFLLKLRPKKPSQKAKNLVSYLK